MPKPVSYARLGFSDRAVASRRQSPLTTRQPTVDGVPLDEALAVAGVADAGSSPLLDDPRSLPENVSYLRSLLGGPPADVLRPGRIGLLFCTQCHDSSCGHLLAAQLDVGDHEVSWSAIGFETEHGGAIVGRLFRKRVVPPPEWWTPNPIAPEIAFTFERKQYFRAVETELARLTQVKELR